MPKITPRGTDFVRLSIKFAISILVLLLLRFVVRRLPMLDGAVSIPPVPGETRLTFALPYFSIGVAIVDTIILVLLLNFGREFASKLRMLYPTFRDIAKLTNLAVLMIALLIAYNSYELIGFALLHDKVTYKLIFFALTAIPLIGFIFFAYKNMDYVTDLVIGKISYLKQSRSRTCPECGERTGVEAKFCIECGHEFDLRMKSESFTQTEPSNSSSPASETILSYAIYARSFKSQTDAAVQARKLAQQGYASTVEETRSDKHGIIYRVKIGEYQDGKSAQGMKNKLTRDGWKVWIVRKQ